jgi:hypothetical protein
VEPDPVKALLGAGRDGLLQYHGFVSGGRYEVDVTGRRRVLASAEVVDFVERLRAVERVGAVADGARLIDLRDDGTHVIDLDPAGSQIEVPASRVVDWSEGFLAAHAGQGQDHTGDDQLEMIAELFERPSRDDQCRMVLLGLMYGRPGDEVAAVKLVELIGQLPDVKKPAKKTIVDALGFGGSLGSDLAEKMIAALGERWRVTADGYRVEGAEAGAAAPEMPGLVALRRIVKASRAGWLRYVDDPKPNTARWKPKRDRWYRMTVGQQEYEVSADSLDAWLDGLETFHSLSG